MTSKQRKVLVNQANFVKEQMAHMISRLEDPAFADIMPELEQSLKNYNTVRQKLVAQIKTGDEP